MRKYLLSFPFAFLTAIFAYIYFNVSEGGVISLDSDDEESLISLLFWGSFIACQLTVPIISKRSIVIGYVALSIPYVLFLLVGALE